MSLSSKEIVREKILTLLEREKPRDFYDLYYILRHPILRKRVSKNLFLKIKDKLTNTEINFKKRIRNFASCWLSTNTEEI